MSNSLTNEPPTSPNPSQESKPQPLKSNAPQPAADAYDAALSTAQSDDRQGTLDATRSDTYDAALHQAQEVHQEARDEEARHAIQKTFQQVGEPVDKTAPQQDVDFDQNPDHQKLSF